MTLRDSPKPTGYFPNTPNQWREATVDDCGWYAAECAFERASTDHISRHPVIHLRDNSVHPGEGGTRPSLVLSEVARMWPAAQDVAYDYGTFGLDHIVRALLSDASIMLNGDYEKLPAHYRRWTNNDIFDHSMCIWSIRLDGKILKTYLYDPLGGGPLRLPYNGEWIPLDALFAPQGFNWRDTSGERYWVGIVANREVSTEVNKINVFKETPATREARVKTRAPAYRNPSVTSQKMRNLANEAAWRPLLGNSVNGFRFILWMQSGAWVGGYVHKSDIIEVRVADRPEAPPSDNEHIKRLEADIIDLTIEIEDAYRTLNEIEAMAEDATNRTDTSVPVSG